MRTRDASLTRRLISAVLLLELAAALGLIVAVTIHEERLQNATFDANLRATSSALLGAVQEDVNDNVLLDLKGFHLPPESIFRVTDEQGRILGSAGVLPLLSSQPESLEQARVNRQSYRFFTLTGEKVIDPDQGGGIHHYITIVYGRPEGHVWHEVMEAVRFSAAVTFVFLGLTALLLVWLIRRLLSPIRELASAAGEISSTRWSFVPPQSARNLVELRPLTSAIETMVARLERAFQQQKRFTSDAAHELKTDLAIVKSSLQLIALKPRTVEEHEQGLAVGLEDLTRLERTVQKMLTLSRLEQPAERGGERCRIEEVLHESILQSQPLADLKSVSVSAPALPSAAIPIDRSDGLLLCSNLIINALQHSGTSGQVKIDACVVDDHLRLTVRDHGEGVEAEEAESLFLPFYRSDASRSRKSGGTGLGLSICKAICERAGGTISIANHKDGGAIVTVVLPTA